LDVSSAAGIASAVLLGLGVAALVRPTLADKLPLGRVAMAAGYLALCLLVSAHDLHVRAPIGGFPSPSGYGRGIAIDAVGAGLVLLGAGFLRFREVVRGWSWRGLTVTVLAAGVCVGLALPWWRGGSQSFGLFHTDWTPATTPGVKLMSGTIAAVIAISVPAAWWRKDAGASASQLGLALGVAVFAGGTYASARQGSSLRYGVWVTLAFVGALLAAAVLLALPMARPARPSWRSIAVAVSATALLASMFFPWAGDSLGWAFWASVVAAGLAALALQQALAPGPTVVPLVELAAGYALLVAVTGLNAAWYFGPVRWGVLRAGAWIGLASGALLLVVALSSLRLRLRVASIAPRIAALLLALVYLVLNVVCTTPALLNPFPESVPARFGKLFYRYFPPTTWMSTVGLVVAIWLIGAWLRPRDQDGRPLRIVLALGLLGLALLDFYSTMADSSLKVALSVNGGGLRLGIYALAALALAGLGALDHVRNTPSVATPAVVALEPS
jgi:hypothetical protein